MWARCIAVALVGAPVLGCASPGQTRGEIARQNKVKPFLLFQDGRAEEAMRYYVSLFPDSEVLSVERYGAGAAGSEGSLEKGVFTVSGQPVMCTDSTVKHAFDFTPSMSLLVDCSTAQEIDRLLRHSRPAEACSCRRMPTASPRNSPGCRISTASHGS